MSHPTPSIFERRKRAPSLFRRRNVAARHSPLEAATPSPQRISASDKKLVRDFDATAQRKTRQEKSAVLSEQSENVTG